MAVQPDESNSAILQIQNPRYSRLGVYFTLYGFRQRVLLKT